MFGANNYNYNPYGTYMQQRPMEQNLQQYMQQTKPYLQGKAVEGIEIVKATDIPYDGTTSYFPSTDGTKIYTKQLQLDGTVKISTYNLEKNADDEKPIYATKEDIEVLFNSFKADIDEIKKALKQDKKAKDDK